MIWRALRGRPVAGAGIFTAVILAACGGSGDGSSPSGSGPGGQGGETSQDGGNDVPVVQSCDPSDGCPSGEGVCHPTRRTCVECVEDNDCDEGKHCAESVCEAHISCASTRDCPVDQVCSQALGRCVECVGDNDCAPDQTCHETTCRDACASDKDCRQEDSICHSVGLCLECEHDTDCDSEQFCSDTAACVPRVCAPSASLCEEGDLATCLENGSGYERTVCELGCADATSCETVPDCVVGDEGCACYPNETCNGALSCFSGLCVDGSAGTGGHDGTGGENTGGAASGGAASGGAGSGGQSTGGAASGGAGSGGQNTGGAASGGTGSGGENTGGAASGGAASGGEGSGGAGPGDCPGIEPYVSGPGNAYALDERVTSICAGGTLCVEAAAVDGNRYEFTCIDHYNCGTEDPGLSVWAFPPWEFVGECTD